MKKILSGIIPMITLLLTCNVDAKGLLPEYYGTGNMWPCQRYVHYPLEGVSFTFDGGIGVIDNSVATLYSGDEALATGKLSCSNFEGTKRTQGTAIITFESPLVLPKGKKYKIVVPEGVIYKESDPTVSNDEFPIDFEVPDNTGDARPDFEDGSVVGRLSGFRFWYGIEISSLEGGKFTLYREDIPIKEYPADTSWDWDLGEAGCSFGGEATFENGVKYTITLAEKSVCSIYRQDIWNKEASFSFVGGYTGNVPSMDFESYRLDGDSGANFIGKVMFVYKTPVALTIEPSVQLTEDGNMIKEVVPTLAQEDDKWVMTADFENTYMNPDKEYSVIIPESTLVTAGADVFVNSREVVKIGGTTGITEVADGEFAVTAENGVVTVGNIVEGSEVKLYTLDGKTVYSSIASEKVISIPAPATGVYILSAGGKTRKISVK